MVEEAKKCMKCGFCMSVCPIYLLDHIESHVARGRNMLINLRERLSKAPSYKEALYFCILCGRCQHICPSGLPNVNITIAARNELVKKEGLGIIQRFVYHMLLNRRPLLANIVRLISYIPGISRNGAPSLRHLADSFFIFTHIVSIPDFSKPFLRERIPLSKQKGKIAFFPGCAFEFLFANTGEKLFYFLKEKLGLDIEYPTGIGCCGFPVYCAGDIETAKKIAKRNIEVLSGYERIITGCATCVSGLRSYINMFEGEDKKKAEKVSSAVMGISEFIVKEKFDLKLSCSSLSVTYHDPCHMRWHQGIFDEPRKIISSIRGVEFIEMKDSDMCCGLGGAFGITHRKESLELQKRKIESIIKTNAQLILTECPGCMIQIKDGIAKRNLPIKVMHLGELLYYSS